MPNQSHGRKRKVGVGHSITVNSLAFIEGGPAATSSPSSVDDHSNIDSDIARKLQELVASKIKAVEEHYEEYVKGLDRAAQLLKLKLGEKLLTTVIEVWSSKSKDVSNNKTDKRTILGDVSNGTTNGKQLKSKRGRPRIRSSSEPRKNNELLGSVQDGVFKKPTGSVRQSKCLRSSSTDRLYTPVNLRHTGSRMRNVATVTPGPNINHPVSMLRRPIPGEMAISLSGSPLLISTETTSTMAHVNVPIDSEKVMSIFPRDGFTTDDIPSLDANTKRQLNMLQEYLTKMCKK